MCPQEGDYRDPFKIAERKERHQASDSEQARQSVIPPAGSPSPGASAGGHQSLLLTAGQSEAVLYMCPV